jgi:hypothetical protein
MGRALQIHAPPLVERAGSAVGPGPHHALAIDDHAAVFGGGGEDALFPVQHVDADFCRACVLGSQALAAQHQRGTCYGF